MRSAGAGSSSMDHGIDYFSSLHLYYVKRVSRLAASTIENVGAAAQEQCG